MCGYHSIISKEQFSHQHFSCQSFRLQSFQTENRSIQPGSDVNSILNPIKGRAAIQMAKRVGARTQPCLMPLFNLNDSEVFPPKLNAHIHVLEKRMTNCKRRGGQPIFSSTLCRDFQLTLSNAFVNSTKAMNSGCLCPLHFSCSSRSVKTILVVDRPALNPDCVSGRMRSANLCRHFRKTLAKILPATERRDIPLRSPLFLYRVMILTSSILRSILHCHQHCSSNACSCERRKSLFSLKISSGIPPLPRTFPFDSALIALDSSSSVGSSSNSA